jgi:DNA-binding transcriptional MerR regulator
MEALLTTAEVAALLRVAPETLRYWRWKRMGPMSIRLGGRVVYRVSAVEQWVEQQAALADRDR